MRSCYRLQMKFAKVMFSQVLSVHRGVSATHTHPPGQTPLSQTPCLGRPPGQNPRADTQPCRHPLGRHFPGYCQHAGSTHPTGMHSCIIIKIVTTVYDKFQELVTHSFHYSYYLFISSYDSTTGIFTIPPGGDGIYYFSINLQGDDDEYGIFEIRLNDGAICATRPDLSGSVANDYPSGSCSAVVDATAGNFC